LQAFQQRGIRAVSTSDLARELGISKKTLYQHYPTKENLVREVLFGILETVWVEATVAMQSVSNPRMALRRYFEVAARLSAAYPPGAAYDVSREYPKLMTEFQQTRSERIARLAVFLERVQASGELAATLDIKATIHVFQALLDTLVSADFQARTGVTLQTIPQYMGFLVDGLFTKSE
jgi:TetR/AcrR family transcriptional regulator, transcriptional repressor of aconitase